MDILNGIRTYVNKQENCLQQTTKEKCRNGIHFSSDPKLITIICQFSQSVKQQKIFGGQLFICPSSHQR